MDFDWERWQTHVAVVKEYLNECSQTLTAEDFTSVLERLPPAYRAITVAGNADASALNRESLFGLIRVLPVLWGCDFLVNSYLWYERKHAGLFIHTNLFKNGYRLTLRFADETVYFKLSKRHELHYKSFLNGEAVIIDQEDMAQIEKIMQMMED